MKANLDRIKANGIVYPQLSYQIMSVLFKVHNILGSKLQEKYYQRAIQVEFSRQKIPFKKELLINLEYEDIPIGRYYIDFVIDDKVALEIKASDYFKKDFVLQVLAYLKSANLKLGIIANFNSDRLLYKRLINSKISEN